MTKCFLTTKNYRNNIHLVILPEELYDWKYEDIKQFMTSISDEGSRCLFGLAEISGENLSNYVHYYPVEELHYHISPRHFYFPNGNVRSASFKYLKEEVMEYLLYKWEELGYIFYLINDLRKNYKKYINEAMIEDIIK